MGKRKRDRETAPNVYTHVGYNVKRCTSCSLHCSLGEDATLSASLLRARLLRAVGQRPSPLFPDRGVLSLISAQHWIIYSQLNDCLLRPSVPRVCPQCFDHTTTICACARCVPRSFDSVSSHPHSKDTRPVRFYSRSFQTLSRTISIPRTLGSYIQSWHDRVRARHAPRAC